MNEATERDQTTHDVGVALFFLVWVTVGWVSLLTNQNLFRDLYGGRDPGPALMPILVLGILTAGCLALMVKPAFALITGRGALRIKLSPHWSTIGCFFSVAVFPLAMQAIGYVPTTLVFVFVWALLLSPELRTRPLRAGAIAAIAAVVTTLVIYVGFDLVIGAQLP